MKNIKMKLLGFAVAFGLLAMASSALAQSYQVQNNGNGLVVARGLMTSGTAVTAVNVDPGKSHKPVYLFLKASAIASATITNELNDGTVLNSQTVAVGTTVGSISWTAPLYFEALRVSTTTALTGTNSVSVTILQ